MIAWGQSSQSHIHAVSQVPGHHGLSGHRDQSILEHEHIADGSAGGQADIQLDGSLAGDVVCATAAQTVTRVISIGQIKATDGWSR